MSLGASLAATAARLVAQYGVDALLGSREAPYDVLPVADQPQQLLTQRAAVRALVLPPGPTADRFGGGTLERQSRYRALFAAQGLTTPPKAGDTLLVDDVEWRLTSTATLGLQGTRILYNAALERA